MPPLKKPPMKPVLFVRSIKIRESNSLLPAERSHASVAPPPVVPVPHEALAESVIAPEVNVLPAWTLNRYCVFGVFDVSQGSIARRLKNVAGPVSMALPLGVVPSSVLYTKKFALVPSGQFAIAAR